MPDDTGNRSASGTRSSTRPHPDPRLRRIPEVIDRAQKGAALRMLRAIKDRPGGRLRHLPGHSAPGRATRSRLVRIASRIFWECASFTRISRPVAGVCAGASRPDTTIRTRIIISRKGFLINGPSCSSERQHRRVALQRARVQAGDQPVSALIAGARSRGVIARGAKRLSNALFERPDWKTSGLSSVLAVMVATQSGVRRLFPTPVGKIPQGRLGDPVQRYRRGASISRASMDWGRSRRPRIRTNKHVSALRVSWRWTLQTPTGGGDGSQHERCCTNASKPKETSRITLSKRERWVIIHEQQNAPEPGAAT